MFEKINQLSNKIKQERPLVLNLTNYVTMDFVANGLLCLGASPVMSVAEEEMEELINLASSVVINLGTLNEGFIKLCRRACEIANQVNKPIILDPVGAGASRYRTQSALNLINDYRMAIVRGNASEIMALASAAMSTKGVDSTAESHEALECATTLSATSDAAVVISGKTDIVVDGNRAEYSHHGSALMPMIVGTGCLLTSVIGAFHAIESDRFTAAVAATTFFGVCGEIAAKKAYEPGTYKVEFLNALHTKQLIRHYAAT